MMMMTMMTTTTMMMMMTMKSELMVTAFRIVSDLGLHIP